MMMQINKCFNISMSGAPLVGISLNDYVIGVWCLINFIPILYKGTDSPINQTSVKKIREETQCKEGPKILYDNESWGLFYVKMMGYFHFFYLLVSYSKCIHIVSELNIIL